MPRKFQQFEQPALEKPPATGLLPLLIQLKLLLHLGAELGSLAEQSLRLRDSGVSRSIQVFAFSGIHQALCLEKRVLIASC